MSKQIPFKYFKTSPEIIRLAVMLYVLFPLSLRNVEDLLHERCVDISYEKIRFWWNRFGPMFAANIRRKRIQNLRAFSIYKWHLDEMYVKINGEIHYLWRAVDHEGEVLEAVVTKRRDKKAALTLLRKLLRRYGQPASIVTDKLKSYSAALRELGFSGHECEGRWIYNRVENSHLLRRRERALQRAGSCEVYRNPQRSTDRFTIISTRNVISTADKITRKIEPLHLLSGSNFAPTEQCDFYHSETGSH